MKKLNFKKFFKHLLFVVFMNFPCYWAHSQQWGDYTLVAVQNNTTATLVDTNGTVFKTWSGLPLKTGYSSYVLPEGKLLRSVTPSSGNSLSGGGMTGAVQLCDYNGNVTWTYTHSSSTYCLHHDICPMPNGNVLMISYEVKTAAEATAAGCTQSISIQSEKIIEVKPTGATTGDIVWEWHVWDHLVQNSDANKANYKSSIVNNPQLLNINYKTTKDWMHMNGIDYNPILDQIVVSSHNLNEIYVIDHSTTTQEAAGHTGGNAGKGGDFLYRWGNPAAYGASGTAVLNVVHDAHWIPEGVPGAGNLVAFNNGGTSSYSTVDQVTPPLNGYNYNLTLGSAYTPTSYTSRLVSNGKTSNMGNSQQLPNGNTLVTIALSGKITEFNSSGTALWSYTGSGTLPQSTRYAKCILGAAGPAIPTITATSGKLTSSSASTYQWYQDGKLIQGATSQSFTPSSSGIYLVKTTDANACFYQYSAGYKFTTVTAAEDQTLEEALMIAPNPTTGIVQLAGYLTHGFFEVKIIDISGKVLVESQNEASIDMNALKKGIYFLNLKTNNNESKTHKIILE